MEVDVEEEEKKIDH